MDARALRALLPPASIDRLANGLRLCLLPSRVAPVVSTALFYRAGTRDEDAGLGGTAHFLEHMMFKGSPRFAPGEIDRLTRSLGGSNNAFTSHDLTAYHFVLAADRWRHALDVEADRMAGLLLDPVEVDSERQVIVEEISMFEGEPWDALEQAVHAALFRRHVYGRPVLGTRDELKATGPAELASFHRRFYRPGNAVLVVAGDLGERAREAVERAFGAVDGAPAARPLAEADTGPGQVVRLERRHGEVPRLLVALPAPAATDADHPALRLLVAVLATGRASRLHRRLVDVGQQAVWVAADLEENLDPGTLSIAVEVVPDADLAGVEAAVVEELARLRREPPGEAELARARRVLLADWVFGHDKVHHQALLAGAALAMHDDLEQPFRGLERLAALTPADLLDAARRRLDPERGAVVGWSLPDDEPEDEAPDVEAAA